MNIQINKNKIECNSVEIVCNNFFIYYELDEKEFLFEKEEFYLFLKTNYPEKRVCQILKDLKTTDEISNAFKKDGFWVIIEKLSNKININRDMSGLCSGYYYSDKNLLHISTNVHDLANLRANKLNPSSVHQLLYFDYLWDGQTIYDNISQIKIGGKIVLNNRLEIESYNFNQPNIIEQENKYNEQENIVHLREEIVNAHKNYLNDKNIVFLSGGIDSVAMIIALDDITTKERIKAHSFKVVGTNQDETVYAKSIAEHLKIDLSIINRKISDKFNETLFNKSILKMNNPYPGMWIFDNQVSNDPFVTYYAGQDTRLHTPSLNSLDKIAFSIFSLYDKGFSFLFKFIDILLYPFKKIFDILMLFFKIENKYFLGLRRALYIFNTTEYIMFTYFKVDKAMLELYKLSTKWFDELKENYKIELNDVKTKRALYNRIVTKKWIEQYAFDMRYMIDMVNKKGGLLAMPFYDMDLAKFSATIPFNMSIKAMKGKAQFGDEKSTINKYILRESLLNKIDKKTYLRSKAVSRTGHLIFNQGLDLVLESIIKKDITCKRSLVLELGLQNFVKKFLAKEAGWQMTDDKYLLKIYYLSCLIVYNNALKN